MRVPAHRTRFASFADKPALLLLAPPRLQRVCTGRQSVRVAKTGDELRLKMSKATGCTASNRPPESPRHLPPLPLASSSFFPHSLYALPPFLVIQPDLAASLASPLRRVPSSTSPSLLTKLAQHDMSPDNAAPNARERDSEALLSAMDGVEVSKEDRQVCPAHSGRPSPPCSSPNSCFATHRMATTLVYSRSNPATPPICPTRSPSNPKTHSSTQTSVLRSHTPTLPSPPPTARPLLAHLNNAPLSPPSRPSRIQSLASPPQPTNTERRRPSLARRSRSIDWMRCWLARRMRRREAGLSTE